MTRMVALSLKIFRTAHDFTYLLMSKRYGQSNLLEKPKQDSA